MVLKASHSLSSALIYLYGVESQSLSVFCSYLSMIMLLAFLLKLGEGGGGGGIVDYAVFVTGGPKKVLSLSGCLASVSRN